MTMQFRPSTGVLEQAPVNVIQNAAIMPEYITDDDGAGAGNSVETSKYTKAISTG
jgi:hypothetical protein